MSGVQSVVPADSPKCDNCGAEFQLVTPDDKAQPPAGDKKKRKKWGIFGS